jgi:hypothetical protein
MENPININRGIVNIPSNNKKSAINTGEATEIRSSMNFRPIRSDIDPHKKVPAAPENWMRDKDIPLIQMVSSLTRFK